MKHLKLFFALFAMLALGVGNAWGADVSVTWPKTTALSTTATNVDGDANVTIKVSEANTYTNPLRFYAGKTTTIEVAEGYQLKSVAYEASSTGNYVTCAKEATVSPDVTPSVNGKIITWDLSGSNTKTFTFKPSSQTRCNGITITYTAASGETPGEGGGEDPETPETGDDAAMTAGTNGTACTVNGKDGIKVGTSSKGGDMKITVPAGATMLHVYAAAWKGVTGLSLNITPTSNVTTTSIALIADAGIANSTPFTLSGNEADYLFDIPLQNITTETTLTFTSSTAKRFVVWGATCETAGGDEPGSGETVVSLIPKNRCLLGGKFT